MTWRIDRNAVAVREARGSSIPVTTSPVPGGHRCHLGDLRWIALRIEGPMHCPARSCSIGFVECGLTSACGRCEAEKW